MRRRPYDDDDDRASVACEYEPRFVWATDFCEADEAAADRETALANLQEQIAKGETIGVLCMYETAAWRAGASVEQTEALFREGAAGGKPSP